MEVRNTSRIVTTPEQIVREHRNRIKPISIRGISPASARVALLEEMGIKKRSSAIFERIIKVFFWIILGWGAGYLHRYLAGG